MIESAVNLNILEILKYPEAISRLRIISTVRYDELNKIAGPISNLLYHYHEDILHFLGDSEQLKATLEENDIKYEEIEPLEVNIVKDFSLLRVLIYKALRRFFTQKGFTWDLRKKNEVFLTNPRSSKLVKDVKKKYKVNLIHEIRGKESDITLTVHEGFRYKINLMEDILTLTIRPKVTPLIQADLSSLKPGADIVCICKLDCPFKPICTKIPRKKIIIGTYNLLDKAYNICPEGFRSLVEVTDKITGNSYEIPTHTIHIEAHPTLISKIGVYREFRKISLKRTAYRTKVGLALLYYLSEGKDEIKIKMGNDTLVISAIPIEGVIEVDEDVWERYRVED